MSAPGDIPITIFDRDTGTTIHPGSDHATHALTRVMSPTTDLGLTRVTNPNPDSNMQVGVLTDQMMLRNVWTPCGACGQSTIDAVICTGCGHTGHAMCFGMELFQGYPFCRACYPQVANHFATLEDQRRRDNWQNERAQKMAEWRRLAIDSYGLSASLGVTIGGAAAAIVGTAIA